MINVQMFHNGVWHDAILIYMWYVPVANAHLFSVKAAAQNGYSTTLNEKEIFIRRGDGTSVPWNKIVHNLYVHVLAIRLCIPRHAAEVHLATQALQVWRERLGHQNKRHVMKVLKQLGINVEAKKEFCDGCDLKKAHRQSFRTRTSRPSLVGEQINEDMCVCVCANDRNISGRCLLLRCFKDDYSKYRRVFFITTQSVGEGVPTEVSERSKDCWTRHKSSAV